jgi:hypothetical protein
VIAGGERNTIGSNSFNATISGGYSNRIWSGSPAATIPGGRANVAIGLYAFAAGYNAKATNQGAFVWSDGTGITTISTNDNSVTFRAGGGYRFFTGTGNSGAFLAAGGGSWASMSDRNAKENFVSVNPTDVLAKVAALPISEWNYKSQNASVRHVGPMAQDFHAAFQVGETDTGITAVDANGVALAAIQGLNEKLEVRSRKSEVGILKLQRENAELKRELDHLKELVGKLVLSNDGGER